MRTELIIDMTLKKHVKKRIGIFLSIFSIITLLFYIRSFMTIDGFDFFGFFIALFFLIFFSIAFLFFEASELKSKKEFASQKFNQLTGIVLIVLLIATLTWFMRAATNTF